MKRTVYLLLVMVVLTVFLQNQSATDEKGVKRSVIAFNKGNKKVVFCENSFALVIGVWDYDHWEKFDQKRFENELNQVETALKKHNFNIIPLKNPSFQQMKKAIEDFRNDYGLDRYNRLLIFFSGHGHSRKNHIKGYLVPRDAPFPDTRNKEKEFLKKSISMDWLKTIAKAMEVNQVLFIFDSCFSGTIFQMKDAPLPEHIRAEMANPVRLFITAGKANQQVPARSDFIPAFIRGINGEADLVSDGYITGKELFLYIRKQVIHRRGLAQTPQYGYVYVSDEQDGDFVFLNVIPNAPKPGDIDVSSLVAEAQKKREEREKREGWARWQEKFKENFDKLKAIDKNPDISPSSKKAKWQELLTAYSKDNLYTSEDEHFRAYINDRIAYWSNYNKSSRVTPAYTNETKGLIEFMDKMYEFVNNHTFSDPQITIICASLLDKKLSLSEFNEIINIFNKKIPKNYDYSMNRFFHVIYVRKKGWQQKAKRILDEGNWNTAVKQKMKEIFKEAKSLLDQ